MMETDILRGKGLISLASGSSKNGCEKKEWWKWNALTLMFIYENKFVKKKMCEDEREMSDCINFINFFTKEREFDALNALGKFFYTKQWISHGQFLLFLSKYFNSKSILLAYSEYNHLFYSGIDDSAIPLYIHVNISAQYEENDIKQGYCRQYDFLLPIEKLSEFRSDMYNFFLYSDTSSSVDHDDGYKCVYKVCFLGDFITSHYYLLI